MTLKQVSNTHIVCPRRTIRLLRATVPSAGVGWTTLQSVELLPLLGQTAVTVGFRHVATREIPSHREFQRQRIRYLAMAEVEETNLQAFMEGLSRVDRVVDNSGYAFTALDVIVR